MINKLIQQILFLLLITSIAQAISVEGNAFLEFHSDHNGIKVLFEAVTPTAKTDSAFTNSEGSYSIDVQAGVYDIIYSKNGFDNVQIEGQSIFSDINLSDVTLLRNIYLIGTLRQGVLIKEAHYIIIGNIVIAPEDSLKIEPGAELRFDGAYEFKVYGILNAVGTVTDSIIFTRNRATEDSKWGGIWFDNGKNESKIEYCRIEYGKSMNRGGGAIYCYQTSPTISHNLLINNISRNGGAIACGLCSPVISENIIMNNTAYQSGASIYLTQSSALIRNNLIVNNYLVNPAPSLGGAGVYCQSSSPKIINNTIVNNISGSSIGAGIYIENILSQPIIINNVITNNSDYGIYVYSGNPSLSYNDVWGNREGNFYNCPPYVGDFVMVNINHDSCDAFLNSQLDPQFVDIDGSDYHLSDLSPCISAGIFSELVLEDLEGNPRPNPSNTYPDIGAFENHNGVHLPIDTTAPSIPKNFEAISGDQQVTLTWAANTEQDLNYYKIYRSQTQNFTPTANDSFAAVFKPNTSYVDNGVSNEQTYYYRITAVDQAGNESDFSGEASATPQDKTAPSTPQNLQATPGDQQISLSWATNSEPDLSYYKIYRSQSQNFTPSANDSIAVVFKPNTSYIDNNVINGQTYYYKISAVDQAGNESNFSDEVSATPRADILPPDISLSLTSYNFENVIQNDTESWGLAVKNIGQSQLVINKIENSLSVFSASPTSCTVNENDSLVITLSFTPTQQIIYRDTFRISSNDPDEAVVQFIVMGQGVSSPKPLKPLNLQAFSGDHKVTLIWKANTESNLSHYIIYRSLSQNFTPTSNDSLAIVIKPDTSYTDTDVINGQTYYYRISAVDSSGNESDFSDEVSATPQAVITPANILLSASSYDFGSVLLDSSKKLTFLIKNSGQESLEIFNIKNTHSVFTANPTSGTINENDSLGITISFTPTIEKVYQDTFKIFSNDPDEAVVQFFVQGQGVTSPRPSIYFSSNSFDFGDVPVFSTSSKQLTIQNKGNGDLNIENIISDNPVFNVSATQFTITPENQQTVQINFTPDNVQTETGTLTITSNDPDQSELQVNLTGTGIDDQAPEITLPSPSQQLWVGSDFQITAQVTDNWNIDSVLLYYRNGTSKTFQISSMNHSQENNYLATIPGSAMLFQGLVYFVKAEDSAGISAFSDTLSPRIYFTNGSFSTNSTNNGYASGYSRGQWRMFSAPAILNNAGVSSVLNDETELGSYGEPNWRLFSYEDTDDDGIKDGYQEYSSSLEFSIFQFASGKAFWLKANPEGEKIIIDVGAGHVLPLENQTITLKPGWNQIANPFAFPIAFNPIHQNIVDKLYLPDGTGGYTLTNSMLPWAGYFVFVNGTEQVSYDIAPVSSTPLHKPIIEKTEWLIQLCAACGNCKDEINFFGISQLSSNDWDKKDYPEPPVIGDYVSLRFPHSDWSEFCEYYTADIRRKIEDGQIWAFEIRSNFSNSDIKLNWEKLLNPKSELNLTLYDKSRNKTVDMNQVSEYFFSPLSQKRVSNFQIFAGDQDFVEQQLEEIREQLPDSYRLLQNYPNPFNSTTAINFELPKEKYVKLILYNMIGEEQKTLVQGNFGVGFHKVLLDAKELSSGLYIYKLEAGGFVDVKKLVVLK
ncbi:choice-of-anchor D domain-containing protein [candidate division KSB1 bacterium]|nr:choice-of-anchor D domain-containing protein [candidate division KSB1 bacterium]